MAMENTTSKPPAPSPEDALMYQALFELPSGELRLEPVTQVRQESALLRYGGPSAPMRVGLELASVRLFQSGTQVLACSATIKTVGPSVGGKTLDIALALRPAQLDSGAQVQQTDVINDMVRNLLDARATAVACVNGVVLACATQLVRAEGQPAYLVLDVRGSAEGFIPKASCDLTCQLYGARVVLRCQVQEVTPGRLGTNTLHVRWPHAMVASRRRTAPRVQKLAVGAHLTARLPFGPGITRHAISDLSRQGFAFEAEANSWITPGMMIVQLEINLPHAKVRGRGSVRNVRQTPGGKLLVGVAFHDLTPAADRTLDEFVGHSTHPTSRNAAARDIPNLWPLFREAGLLKAEVATKEMRQFESTRSLLLTRAPQLLLQTVQGNAEALSATAELARVGEKAWRLQHVFARSGDTPTDSVVEPLLQVFMKRHDTDFLQMLIPVASPAAFDPQALHEVIPTPHQYTRVWGRVSGPRAAAFPAQSEEEIRTAGQNDRTWVAQKLQSLLSPLEIEALDCGERRLPQNELSRLYRNVGLDYQRIVRLVSSVSEALGFSLIESSPMGLSLDGLLPAARIFAVTKSAARRGPALASLVQDAANLLLAQGHLPTCLVTAEDAAVLARSGYKTDAWYVEITVERGSVMDLPAALRTIKA